MKRLRGILIADPAVIISTLGFGLVSLAISYFDRKRNGFRQHWLAQVWAKLLLRTSSVRVNAEGLKWIEPNQSYIFVSNHLSYMDTPVIMGHIPVQFRFLAKLGLFKIPMIGTHLSRAGHIRVPREDPRGAVRTMQLAAEIIQKQRISLLIFPEGGRSRDGVLRPFKEGAAYIAIRAGVPIVPLVLIGTREILPYGSAVVEPGTVTMRILQPIETSSMSLKDRGALTTRLRDLIAGELGEKVKNDAPPVASTTAGLG